MCNLELIGEVARCILPLRTPRSRGDVDPAMAGEATGNVESVMLLQNVLGLSREHACKLCDATVHLFVAYNFRADVECQYIARLLCDQGEAFNLFIDSRNERTERYAGALLTCYCKDHKLITCPLSRLICLYGQHASHISRLTHCHACESNCSLATVAPLPSGITDAVTCHHWECQTT